MVEKKKGKGKITAITIKQANATVALPFIRAMACQCIEIQTDESRIYHRVKREYTHRFINPSKEEYSVNGISTNTIEGFWSQMKRSIDGMYYCVSPKYLQLLLDGDFVALSGPLGRFLTTPALLTEQLAYMIAAARVHQMFSRSLSLPVALSRHLRGTHSFLLLLSAEQEAQLSAPHSGAA